MWYGRRSGVCWEKLGMMEEVLYIGRSVVCWKKCIVYCKKCGIMGEVWYGGKSFV